MRVPGGSEPDRGSARAIAGYGWLVRAATAQGVGIPVLGYGTWELDGDDCENGVAHALRSGYRHIDTAQMYGNEDRVGAAVRSSEVAREEIFLTTKIANDSHARDDVLRTTEQSLDLLGTDYVDLLLIHWPEEEVPLGETLMAMTEVQDEGRARHLGVSNFPPSLLREATRRAPVLCDQVERHPFLAQRQLLEVAEDEDLVITAYSPLARGRVMRDGALREIADAHQATPAQVALRWCVQDERVSAIPKATSPERIDSNLGALELELSAEELARIDALDQGEREIDPAWAPDWEQ